MDASLGSLFCAGPLQFESANGTKRSDAAFLEVLRKEAGPGKDNSAPTLAQIKKLSLKETDIAKVRQSMCRLSQVPTQPADQAISSVTQKP